MAKTKSTSIPVQAMESTTSIIDKIFIIGIDPGRNGGIVGLTNGHINVIDKMPQQPTDLWGYFVDVLGIPMIGKDHTHVFIEDVHSMPTDGVRSAFSFGRHLGHLDMLLTRYDLPTSRIVPSKWMAHFALQRDKMETKYQYKKRILQKAKEMAPKSYVDSLSLATADAYFIATYGYETLKEELLARASISHQKSSDQEISSNQRFDR